MGKGMVERALRRGVTSRCCWWISPFRAMSNRRSGKLANAYLYSVDDLQNIIQHNLAQRKSRGGAGGIDRRAGDQRIYGLAARAERQRDDSRIPFSV
ncbi:hypothetical protein LNP17_18985 [Klebsiella variicola subsp. variicola]|nr:hypothetical protein [Klebsiella variicola subsp. variicola]